MEWVSIEEAREASGLRLVLTVGVPGPWSEAAKGLFHVERVPHVRVAQIGGDANDALRAWTGETNAPQAVLDDQPPVTRWNDLIFMADRRGADDAPALLPDAPRDRALMFGLLHEIAGEQGFGWNRRLMLLHPVMALPGDHPVRAAVQRLADRYGYSPAAAEAAPARAAEVVALISAQWREQLERGHDWLIGDRLSALDIYWAAFAALLSPLPPEVCAMNEALRRSYAHPHPLLEEALDPGLLEHRDRIYREYLEYPLDLGPAG